MKRKNVINVLISIIIVAILTFAFVSCGSTNTEDETASLSTTEEAVTDEVVKPNKPTTTEDEKEETTTKAPETTKPQPTKPQPTQPKPTDPKPTQPKPTEPKPTQPSGGGLDTWDDGPAESGLYIQDPNENVDHWVDKEAEDLGENLDWELN
ncbi:MAG: hypothetical protein J6A49_09950 [Clostridia bacterium]|nr:hypothetical protein [Clostridia bacterium]